MYSYDEIKAISEELDLTAFQFSYYDIHKHRHIKVTPSLLLTYTRCVRKVIGHVRETHFLCSKGQEILQIYVKIKHLLVSE